VSEWVEWHAQYAEGTPLTQRLGIVQRLLREALDRCAPGPVRLISMCAGDGRDVLSVLEDHPRRADVHARLVELDPDLAARARSRAHGLSTTVEVVNGDASTTTAYAGAVPADIALVCGVFGNISDADIRRTVDALPSLCAPDATVIWTRGAFAPDLTPSVRRWFAEAGFSEIAFEAVPDSTARVGADRLTSPPRPFEADVRLFGAFSRRSGASPPPPRRPSR